jgi:hypothetical protein
MKCDRTAEVPGIAALAGDPGHDFGAETSWVLSEEYFCLIAINYYG